jgi:hypothetical protein
VRAQFLHEATRGNPQMTPSADRQDLFLTIDEGLA